MRFALAVVSVIAVVAAPPPSDIDPAIRAVMTRYLRFTTTELAELQSGKIVRHSVDASAPGEIAVAGAVRIRSTKEAFLDRVRDIAEFKRGPDVLQIGRFSTPPTLPDLAGLTIDRDDFDLRSCRIADCTARLPADAIRRFQEINADAPDAPQRIAALFKEILLDHVVAYEKGDMHGRIVQYDDDQPPIRPADEFEAVLRESPALAALMPGLPDHLRHYPASRVENAEDFLYWSKERFGIAPFITATHVTIACPSANTCVVTTRDVYSSRYIDASLAISIATDALSSRDHFYLVYVNRSRANALKGTLAALRRALAGRRARSSLEESLKTIRNRLEQTPP
jgi:hypothetical protein